MIMLLIKQEIILSMSIIVQLMYGSNLLALGDDIGDDFSMETNSKNYNVGQKLNSSSTLDEGDFVEIRGSHQNAEEERGARLDEKQFLFLQNKKFEAKEIVRLIQKGGLIIQDLLNNEKIEDIYNKQKLEIFKDKGKKFFEGYITDHNVGVVQLTNCAWKLGSYFFPSMRQPDKSPEKTLKRQTQLEAVIAVAWAIAYAPCIKEEGFVRGSFSIIDDNQLLSNFFKHYAMQAAGVQSMEINDLTHPTNLGGSNFAYNRTANVYSSHYRGDTIYQIGIDTRFESNGYPLKVLPFENKHILFGRVRTDGRKEKTFFKLEEEGLGDLSSVVLHGLNYVKPVENPRSMRREKDNFLIINGNYDDSKDDLGYRTGNEKILSLEEIASESKTSKMLIDLTGALLSPGGHLFYESKVEQEI